MLQQFTVWAISSRYLVLWCRKKSHERKILELFFLWSKYDVTTFSPASPSLSPARVSWKPMNNTLIFSVQHIQAKLCTKMETKLYLPKMSFIGLYFISNFLTSFISRKIGFCDIYWASSPKPLGPCGVAAWPASHKASHPWHDAINSSLFTECRFG